MAAFRACLIVVAVLGFFLFGAPLQWLIARRVPSMAGRIPMVFCRSLLRLFRIEVMPRGEALGGPPALVVANHTSWIDILAFGSVRPFCFVAKREVGTWPILSAFAEVQGTIFIDRKRRRTIPTSNRRMAERMLGGRIVLLFPEGTTVAGPRPGPFLTSHFAAARELLCAEPFRESVAVQPAAIWYSSKEAAWVGDDDLLSHIWRMLRSPPLRCFVQFAEPLPFRATSDRKAIAHQAREAILHIIEAAILETAPGSMGRSADVDRAAKARW